MPSAEVFRRWGYLAADLDPLGRLAPVHHPDLDAALRDAERSEEAASWRRIYCRLNVMAQVVGVPPSSLFADFEDIQPESVMGSGDLRYHIGATGTYRTPSGRELHIHLVSNPSHLEAVDPVMAGRARARQERLAAGSADAGGRGGRRLADARARGVPVLLHGHPALAGQGVAAETLNLSPIPGFSVGGTVHVVVDNLIGFTTEPKSLHSSRFASDVAKRLDIPILHVNGVDPEAAARAGRMALDYRAAFGTDVVVDLIGYRRYGHSEVDDPTTSQPLLYATIQGLPMLWRSYAERIGASGEEIAALERDVNDRLRSELDTARAMTRLPPLRTRPGCWRG